MTKPSYLNHLKILIVPCFIILYYGCNPKNDKNKLNEMKIGELTSLNALWEFSLKFNNEKINPEVSVEQYSTGKRSLIKNIFTTREALVLQYSELNCNICIDSALNDFKDFSRKVKNKNDLFIIAVTGNRRYMSEFVRINNLELQNIYIIDAVSIKKLYKAETNMPFLFTTNADLKISNAFIPFKEMPYLSNHYFSQIFDKYYK